jgi:DNA mismatch repair ATPase MutS
MARRRRVLHDRPGDADRSYGIRWRLAGLPASVIARARPSQPLEETTEIAGRAVIDDLPLFPAAARAEPATDALRTSSMRSRPDELSPRER